MKITTIYHGQEIELTPASELPNSEGFHFIGFDTEGNPHRCEVVKDPVTGLHSVEGMALSEMVGWFC